MLSSPLLIIWQICVQQNVFTQHVGLITSVLISIGWIAYMACLHQLQREKLYIPHCQSLLYNASMCRSSAWGMRSHLITSIESGKATPFPVIKKQTRRKRLVDTVYLELHCVCRLPDNGTPMIKCDECLCWFHAVCVNAVLGEKPWFCQTCSTN